MIGDHERDVFLYTVGRDMDYDASGRYADRKGNDGSQCRVIQHPRLLKDELELEFGECVLGWSVVPVTEVLDNLDTGKNYKGLSVYKDIFGGAIVCKEDKWGHNRCYLSQNDIARLRESISNLGKGG